MGAETEFEELCGWPILRLYDHLDLSNLGLVSQTGLRLSQD